jgi:hypothetical protein
MLKPNSRINFDDLKKLEGTELLKAILSFIIAFRERDEHNTGKLYAFGCLLYKELLPKINSSLTLEIDALFDSLYQNAKLSETTGRKNMTGALMYAQERFLKDLCEHNNELTMVFNEIIKDESFVKTSFINFYRSENNEEVAQRVLKGVRLTAVNFDQRVKFLKIELLDNSSETILSEEVLIVIIKLCSMDYSWLSAIDASIKETKFYKPLNVTFDGILVSIVRLIETKIVEDEQAQRVARKIRNDNKHTVFGELFENGLAIAMEKKRKLNSQLNRIEK